jgi:hypothetical protein
LNLECGVDATEPKEVVEKAGDGQETVAFGSKRGLDRSRSRTGASGNAFGRWEAESPAKGHRLVDGRSVAERYQVKFEIILFGLDSHSRVDKCIAIEVHVEAFEEGCFPWMYSMNISDGGDVDGVCIIVLSAKSLQACGPIFYIAAGVEVWLEVQDKTLPSLNTVVCGWALENRVYCPWASA